MAIETNGVLPSTKSSVDEEVPQFTFASEALGIPAEHGYGWAQFKFGDTFGKESRYTIARKLGWGMHSSTWLVRDNGDGGYVAVKVLTGYMTKLYYNKGWVWEPQTLSAVTKAPSSPHCPQLLGQFTEPGRGSAGQHLCLVMPLYGGDVKALHTAGPKRFAFPLVKRILLHVLHGIAHAHDRGVAHTNIKHDNIFYETHMSMQDVEDWMTNDPSSVHPPEQSIDGIVQAAVSQPLPLISHKEALRATFLLADFSSALPSKTHDNVSVSQPALRAPEVYLGGTWSTPVDIWSLGLLAYQLFTSRPLFYHSLNKKFGLTKDENMLYQMMCCTGEDFMPAQLSVCPLVSEYFGTDCELKKNPTVVDWPFERSVAGYFPVDAADAQILANFLRRCLRLDPMDRAKASELLSDPLFHDID